MDDRPLVPALAAAAALMVVSLFLMAALAQSALSSLLSGPARLLGSVFSESSTDTGCLDVAGIWDGAKDLDELAALVEVFDEEQRANAVTVITAARQVGAPPRAWVIAVATAIQESSLRNVGHGDTAGPDSRGLFQQRAAWAPEGLRMDPAAATALFLTGGQGGQPGLLDVPGWRDSALITPAQAGRAAQAVQRSAHPGAYAQHMETALVFVMGYVADTDLSKAPHDRLVTATFAGAAARPWTSGSCRQQATNSTDSTEVRRALDFAREQLGLPYQWGGNGPDRGDRGFDCSGLTAAAYRAAGIALPRTAQLQYEHGPHVPLDSLQPGDLVFFGSSTADVDHVGLYLGENQMIDAPHTGAVVRIEDHRWDNLLGATRPAGMGVG
ncbi:NlpC/P60 family protein [Kineosporia rhizophila]|uniref:NlpC/P60 family protein n=1 Tax=Kineosporia TaxID=49184 RepID=UPI001E2D7D4D|nr:MULTISPECIES: NlpC/P60 family protein [Kineosporia]MCE0539862.1 NlpC/P60 family protein [Kineosporia rhizophila]GLY19755.1 hypothetical protein Kisp01_67690 [Kineosporia sp. NBRC 101677]